MSAKNVAAIAKASKSSKPTKPPPERRAVLMEEETTRASAGQKNKRNKTGLENNTNAAIGDISAVAGSKDKQTPSNQSRHLRKLKSGRETAGDSQDHRPKLTPQGRKVVKTLNKNDPSIKKKGAKAEKPLPTSTLSIAGSSNLGGSSHGTKDTGYDNTALGSHKENNELSSEDDENDLASGSMDRRLHKSHEVSRGSESRGKREDKTDKIKWVIETRLNNGPNHKSKTSTAGGPRSWGDVAKMYNNKYQENVMQQVLERQYARNRKKLDYPDWREITYTGEKVKKTRKRKAPKADERLETVKRSKKSSGLRTEVAADSQKQRNDDNGDLVSFDPPGNDGSDSDQDDYHRSNTLDNHELSDDGKVCGSDIDSGMGEDGPSNNSTSPCAVANGPRKLEKAEKPRTDGDQHVDWIDPDDSSSDYEDDNPNKRYRNTYGACKPPHEISEAADIRNYFAYSRPIHERDRQLWTTIYLDKEDGNTNFYYDVLTEDLRASSRFVATRLEEVLSFSPVLIGNSKRTLTRYFDCISPIQRSRLPEFDYSLCQVEDASGRTRLAPITDRIVWDIEATIDLYALATKLEDDNVRDIVLQYWDAQFNQNAVEYEFSQADLNLLFNSTKTEDPARRFWIDAIISQGQAEAILGTDEEEWHSTFIEMLKTRLRDLEHRRVPHFHVHVCDYHRSHGQRTEARNLTDLRRNGSSEPSFEQIAERAHRFVRRNKHLKARSRLEKVRADSTSMILPGLKEMALAFAHQHAALQTLSVESQYEEGIVTTNGCSITYESDNDVEMLDYEKSNQSTDDDSDESMDEDHSDINY